MELIDRIMNKTRGMGIIIFAITTFLFVVGYTVALVCFGIGDGMEPVDALVMTLTAALCVAAIAYITHMLDRLDARELDLLEFMDSVDNETVIIYRVDSDGHPVKHKVLSIPKKK